MKHDENIKIKHPLLIIFFITLVLFFISDLSLGLLLLKRDKLRIDHPYYHHDLRPMMTENAKWGDLKYIIRTNSLGFKDSATREVDLDPDKNRILIIGDSFTEGLGYDYEQTFCGLLQEMLKDSVEILNAGVTSYSPKLYYLKVKKLLEKGLKFNRLIVMLDISDMQDECIYEYFVPRNNVSNFRKIDIILSNYSFSYNKLFRDLMKKIVTENKDESKFADAETILETSIDDRGKWTYDKDVYNEWGKKGVELASKNLLKLSDLCKKNSINMSLVVYPWPEQILENDSMSYQSTYWNNFSRLNRIDFVNLFLYFFESGDSQKTIDGFFIHGDDHWNAEGHKKVAEKLYENMYGTAIDDKSSN